MKKIIHIFDCDGVLLNSNGAKIEALCESLKLVGCPVEFIEWAAIEFRKNFGRTRKQHFYQFKKKLLLNDYLIDPRVIDEAFSIYSERVVYLYGSCDVIEETLSFILMNIDRDNLFVVSASDEVELKNILPERIPEIKKENIFGGPTSKIENLDRVKKIIGSGELFFYGDAVQDAKAAAYAGAEFLALTKYSADSDTLKEYCSNKGLRYVADLSMVDS